MAGNKDIAIRLSLQDGDKVERSLNRLGAQGQAALAKIERSSAPASKGLLAVSRVAGEARNSFSGLAARLGPVGAGLTALGPGGLAAAAGIAVTVTAFTGLVRASTRAADAIAQIGGEAKQAGVAVEFYQELQFAAEKYSVTQDALTDGLKELALRADEFVKTGGGSAAESFQRIGFTQDALQGELQDTGKLFLEIVKRMQGLESEAARIRVADELFGGQGGEQFVRLIAAGEDGIRAMMAQARELGYVIDESMVRKADETRDRLNQISRLIDIQLNQALLELAPIAVEIAESFADMARWVNSVVDSFRDLENKSLLGKKDEAARLIDEIATLENRLQSLEAVSQGNPALAATSTRGLAEQIEAKRRDLELLQAAIREIERGPVSIAPAAAVYAPAESDAAKTVREKVSAAIADLQFELDQLGNSEFDQKIAQRLRNLGLEMKVLDGGIIEFSDTRAGEIYEMSRQLEAAAVAEKARADAQKQGETLTKSLRTTEEARIERLTEIQDLLNAGAITEETAGRARVAANEDAAKAVAAAEETRLRASTDAADGIKRALMDIRDASSDAAGQWEEDIRGMTATARESFIDISLGAQSMSDALSGILNNLQRRLAGRVFDQGVGKLFDGALDSFFGSAHTGGVVGSGLANRQVNPAVFAGAPRLHGGGMIPGLRPGERPIIALKTERVLTEAQQDNTAKTIAGLAAMARNSGGGGVRVNVYNQGGDRVRARVNASQNRNGGLDLDVILEQIEQSIWENVGRGEGGAGVLEGRYGLDPAVGARR